MVGTRLPKAAVIVTTTVRSPVTRAPAALYYAAFLATSDRQAVTAFAEQLPVPEGLLAEQPVATIINGLRLACECGNRLWAM
ncbi:hypothetical protein STRCI_008386 [Streptomyces cinnabarinus]|uniref:Uncharacterized protein n=1 Tax=Streptomyces cinnabarinus TaxID=67287 RepID=A0ABY7KT01_9ACTN|nr:hypothetical protein [Streptomyces cinnabarinus]WAZ26755.1 hypothetical protein STRCI_008386 [Streptomyces cinnabarinus]